MSYSVAGIAYLTSFVSVVGGVFLMFGHGLVSAGLFFLIGSLYERYKTRNIKYFGGIVLLTPVLVFNFLCLTLANTAFPGTCNFIGELLILLGIADIYFDFVVIAIFCVIFCSVYAIWLFNRISFGENKNLTYIADLNTREMTIGFSLLCLIIALGLFPSIFLNDFQMAYVVGCYY